MPLVTIRRDETVVDDSKAIELINLLQACVAEVLQVKPAEVELRVSPVGPLDRNYAPIGIEIDTGTGKGDWRVNNRTELVQEIALRIFEAGILPKDWLGPEKSYVWLRIFQSRFVPIGFPDQTR